jgi:uncharacterized OB-fold protein
LTNTIDARGLIAVIDGEPHLVGVRCNGCGTHAFPAQRACPRCGSPTQPVALPHAGAVWSWTVQRTRPKPSYAGPEEFQPFAVGYIDLGSIRVEGRLDGRGVDAWAIGDPVRLVAGEPDAHGDVWSYRFVPAGESA